MTLTLFHVHAIVPDLVLGEGTAHSQWESVFLGHIAEHYLPGGAVARLAIALVLCSTYVAALTVWLRGKWANTAINRCEPVRTGT